MNKTRDSEFKIAKELRRANRIKGLALLHLKDGFSNEVVHTNEHESADLLEKIVTGKEMREKLANIRTDLDAFHDLEAQALIQSGYEITAHWFETYGKQQEWKYFDREAKKEIRFDKLNKKIEKDHAETLRILDISSEVLFKFLKLYKLDRWVKFISIVMIFWMLCSFYQTILPLLGVIILVVAFLYIVFKKYLKQRSNGLLYWILKPISFIYLSCFNDLYLKKGKL